MEVPGIDKIPNFWISSLSKGHEKLESLSSEIVESPDTSPKWLSKGITYLSLKTKDIKDYHLFNHYIQSTHIYYNWKKLHPCGK